MLRVLICVALLAGCSSGAASPSATRSSKPTGRDPVGRLVLTAVPAGFHVLRARDTGPTDLATAARDDGSPDARAVLTRAGFERGYQRLWSDPAGETIGVSLYRFRTAHGAQRIAARALAVARHQAQHVVPFAVGIDGATGLEVDVEGNRTDQVIVARGRMLVQLICTSRHQTALRDRADDLARRQMAALAAG